MCIDESLMSPPTQEVSHSVCMLLDIENDVKFSTHFSFFDVCAFCVASLRSQKIPDFTYVA